MKKYLLYIYIGVALNIFADLDFLNWRFYAILIPIAILETFANYKPE
jgi:hypothetical protein